MAIPTLTAQELFTTLGPWLQQLQRQNYGMLAGGPGARTNLAMLNMAGQNMGQDMANRWSGSGSRVGDLGMAMGNAASAFGRGQYQGGLEQAATQAGTQQWGDLASIWGQHRIAMDQQRAQQKSMWEKLASAGMGALGSGLLPGGGLLGGAGLFSKIGGLFGGGGGGTPTAAQLVALMGGIPPDQNLQTRGTYYGGR